MLKNAPINYQLLKSWSRVWLVRTSVGVKTSSSWKITFEVWLVMCCWPVSLSLILEPSLPNSDLNSGKTFGCQILLRKVFLTLKAFNLSKYWPVNPWKLDGKMKACLLIICHSKTPQSSHHAPDGHYSLILSFKDQAGSEDLKETIFPPLASIRNIGWDSWLKTYLKVEQCSWKVFRKKLKLPLIPSSQEQL